MDTYLTVSKTSVIEEFLKQSQTKRNIHFGVFGGALKMDAAGPSVTLVTTYETTRCLNPEEHC
jgi:hypothetical protein